MKIDIQLFSGAEGKFSTIVIRNHESEEHEVQLNIRDFESLHDFSGDHTSVACDFLFISAVIYGIDDLFARDDYSINGWTREFEVEIPIQNQTKWNPVKADLSEAVSFLTGDLWKISFRKSEIPYFTERIRRVKSKIPTYNYEDYSFASLFSGGLDSLIGVINEIENLPEGQKGIFISHSDGDYPGPQIDQDRVSNKLVNFYGNRFVQLPCRVGLNNRTTRGEKINRDGNQRSRSILFLGLSTYVVHQIPHFDRLVLPENGTISINHPLTPSRCSSLSTRTTHPFFIELLKEIFIKVGIKVSIDNPFKFMTKGEMVVSCKNAEAFKQAYFESVSCGKRGHKVHWKNRNARQCGTCMPCLYRRAALHKLSLDTETYGNDILDEANHANLSKKDIVALIDYLNTNLTPKKIRRNLVVNGNIKTDLTNYSELIQKSRQEILSWISAKGHDRLKEVLGIR